MLRRRSLRGKVALVTGATGGLGRALCRAFAEQGADLGLLDLDEAALGELAAELAEGGTRCATGACDVRDEAACERAVRGVLRALGGIDVLVNNAGITQRSAFADTGTDVFRRVMDVNFFGSLHCTRAALDALIERRGQIVVLSSVAGLAPVLGRTGYAASKHALRGFFGSLQAELRGTGVGVTMVYPAFIDTGLEHRALGGDGQVTDHPQSRVGRVMTADEAAREMVRAAMARRRTLVLGTMGHLSRMLHAHWPAAYEWLMTRSLSSELER